MKTRSLFAAVVFSMSSIAFACQLDVYTTNTTLPDAIFSNMHCGKPTSSSKWGTNCLSYMETNMAWFGPMSGNGYNAELSLTGTAAYFVLDYFPGQCNADFEVDQNQALLFGTKYFQNGMTRKFYAAYTSAYRFNTPVSLVHPVKIFRRQPLPFARAAGRELSPKQLR